MRNAAMTKKIMLAAALVFMTACARTQSQEPVTRDGIFIHITHGTDDPHRVAMALNMAVMMSNDYDVLVYLDIKGIEVVLKDAPDIAYAHFPGSRAQLAALTGKGITVAACPGCLKAAGKTPDDLLEGISVADKNRFFNFTKGRILTLDY
jgi:predicted peroxiredoxin